MSENAKKHVEEILSVVRENWIPFALKYGLSRRQIEEMRPAFSVCFE